MAPGDSREPVRDLGRDAGSQPMPETENVMCPCCGQQTTKDAIKQKIDTLQSSTAPNPMAGMGGMEDSTGPADMGGGMDEGSMARKYA